MSTEKNENHLIEDTSLAKILLEEHWKEIFSHCDFFTVLKIPLVNKNFNNILTHRASHIWEEKYKKIFSFFDTKYNKWLNIQPIDNWREICIRSMRQFYKSIRSKLRVRGNSEIYMPNLSPESRNNFFKIYCYIFDNQYENLKQLFKNEPEMCWKSFEEIEIRLGYWENEIQYGYWEIDIQGILKDTEGKKVPEIYHSIYKFFLPHTKEEDVLELAVRCFKPKEKFEKILKKYADYNKELMPEKKFQRYPIEQAIGCGNMEAVKFFVEENNFAFDERSDEVEDHIGNAWHNNFGAIKTAAAFGRLEILKYFMQEKFIKKQLTEKEAFSIYLTLAKEAAAEGQVTILKYLEAQLGPMLQEQDFSRIEAQCLKSSAQVGYLNTVEYLCRENSSIHLAKKRDKWITAALEEAKEYSNGHVVKYLTSLSQGSSSGFWSGKRPTEQSEDEPAAKRHCGEFRKPGSPG